MLAESRRATLAAILLISAAPPVPAQDRQTLRHPDGSRRSSWHVQRSAEGHLDFGGEFRQWSEEGPVIASGGFSEGVRSGTWTLNYPDGEMRERGDYQDGLREGLWREWSLAGALVAEGEYRNGFRVGEWRRSSSSGRMGTVWFGFERSGEGSGPEESGRRNGSWVLHGPGGSRAEGHYSSGWPEGSWRFWHADGTPDPQVISGQYVDGERTSLSSLFWKPETRDYAPAPWRRSAQQSLPEIQLTQEESTAVGDILEHLRDGPQPVRTESLDELVAMGVRAMPILLAALVELDLEQVPHVEFGGKLIDSLSTIFKGQTYPWRLSTLAVDRDFNRLQLLRWHHLWHITTQNESWLDFSFVAADDESVPTAAELGADTALELLSRDQFPALYQLATFVTPLPETRARQERLRWHRFHGASTSRAQDWLAAHQSPDGSWDCDGFPASCRSNGNDPCGGEGRADLDVGVTALALLAFLASGETPYHGYHRTTVLRGVQWLLNAQDPSTGRISRMTRPAGSSASMPRVAAPKGAGPKGMEHDRPSPSRNGPTRG